MQNERNIFEEGFVAGRVNLVKLADVAIFIHLSPGGKKDRSMFITSALFCLEVTTFITAPLINHFTH